MCLMTSIFMKGGGGGGGGGGEDPYTHANFR